MGKTFTADEIDKKGSGLVQANRKDKQKEFGFIEPEYLFGWREGSGLDVESYDGVGFTHPKPHKYYHMEFNEAGEPERSKCDPEFLSIYDSIVQSNKIDEPITVYFFGGKILVLDGATRVSCISYRRRMQPGFMDKVPYRLFTGPEDQARGHMIRLNLDGRKRVIRHDEFVKAVLRLRGQMYDLPRIKEIISGNERGNYALNHQITVAYYGCAELNKRVAAKTIPLNIAAQIAEVNDAGKQIELIKSLKGTESVGDVKLKTRGIQHIGDQIDQVKNKVLKLIEYAARVGLKEACEENFGIIQEELDTLRKLFSDSETRAMCARESEYQEQTHESANADAESVDDEFVHAEFEDQDDPERLAMYSASLELGEKHDAGEPADEPEYAEIPVPEEEVIPETHDEPSDQEKPDEKPSRSSRKRGGVRRMPREDKTKFTPQELRAFFKAWWQEFNGQSVNARMLITLAMREKSFAYINKFKESELKQAGAVMTRYILNPNIGPAHVLDGKYIAQERKIRDSLFKLLKL
jgi:hypothetical protein